MINKIKQFLGWENDDALWKQSQSVPVPVPDIFVSKKEIEEIKGYDLKLSILGVKLRCAEFKCTKYLDNGNSIGACKATTQLFNLRHEINQVHHIKKTRFDEIICSLIGPTKHCYHMNFVTGKLDFN